MLITIFIILIILLHIGIFWVEMFGWETLGPKVFTSLPRELFPQTKTLAANQGLYNLFLVVGLMRSLCIHDPSWSLYVALFFLSCVAMAGIYGGISSSKKIFLVQGLPALITIAIILYTLF